MVPAGTVERLFAYQVSPHQETEIQGGEVTTNVDLQETLDVAYDQAKLPTASSVTFNVDPSTRHHHVREALMKISFGDIGEANANSLSLANKLAAAMDHRSKPALLTISVHLTPESPLDRRVILWTFPQQEVLSFSAASGDAVMRLVDAFTKEGTLRKAAMFEGGQARNDFLSGRVLDSQSGAESTLVATFWIEKFLEASLQMGSKEGTQTLAQILRKTHEKYVGDPESQMQVQAAIVAIRASGANTTSISLIEKRYLNGDIASTFHDLVKREDRRLASFEIDRDLFDKQVQFKVYLLDNGVLVSAPFQDLESTVSITVDGDVRHLSVSGVIFEEKLRTRRA